MFWSIVPVIAGCSTGATLSFAWLGLTKVREKRRPAEATPPAERRFHPRMAMRFNAVLHVRNGAPAWRVRGMDISRFGAMVETNEPVVAGNVVFFHSLGHGKMGFARVRYCAGDRGVANFRVGLEFTNELMMADLGHWHIRRQSAA